MKERLWYKGNLHTHTTESDGDAHPEDVVEWYKQHEYDFLVLSDHNHRTILDHEIDGGPLMVTGEEVSAKLLGSEAWQYPTKSAEVTRSRYNLIEVCLAV